MALATEMVPISLKFSNEIHLLTCFLHLYQLTIFLKKSSKKANLNQIGKLTGQSFSVGAALDLLDKNILLEKIMLRSDWKSEASAIRYRQSWNGSGCLIVS